MVAEMRFDFGVDARCDGTILPNITNTLYLLTHDLRLDGRSSSP